MRLEVNGTAQEITATTLDAALVELGWGAARVATAVNGVFVPIAERSATALTHGDRLEVLTAMQGG